MTKKQAKKCTCTSNQTSRPYQSHHLARHWIYYKCTLHFVVAKQ